MSAVTFREVRGSDGHLEIVASRGDSQIGIISRPPGATRWFVYRGTYLRPAKAKTRREAEEMLTSV